MVKMRNALVKDTFREIKRTLSRFLSIFFIVAIGVSFFAGVKATCPDMKVTADKYFDDYNLMDIRLLSTVGFNNQDIKAIEKTDGISGIMHSYSMDAMININDRDIVLKVLSFSKNKLNSSDDSYINRVKLLEGRYPEKPSECLAERSKIINSGLMIGSKIKLSSGIDKDISEKLKINEFTIVGIVETPYYISFERGASSIGNGKVNNFIMIPEENFNMSVFTDVFLTVKGAKDALCYDKGYDSILSPVKNTLENLGKNRVQIRYNDIISDANKKLNESKDELKKSEVKQKTELANAALKLDDSRKRIESAEKELKVKENEFNNTVKEAEGKISEGFKKLSESQKEYNYSLAAFNQAKKQAEIEFKASEDKITASQNQIDQKQAEINKTKDVLSSSQNLSYGERLQMEAAVKSGEQQLTAAITQLEAAKTELQGEKNQLRASEGEIIGVGKTLQASKISLDSQANKLEASKKKAIAEFKDAQIKIDNSKKELQKGQADFESSKIDSDKKLSDARVKIQDAHKKIDDIEKPVWYVLDRNTNPGFVDYGNAADRMDAISKVFPVFFFLVAALVCLTTMTRMVDEQRTYIGTLKALGYSKTSISLKYILYASLASISGSIFGFTVGFKIFPTVIFNAYRIMYTLPDVITLFNKPYAITSTAFAVLSTTLAAWFACNSELAEAPALLMRPRAPKAGKRILLERIKFIWSRFNFTQKITARNLFRYKKRFLMTVIGVGGCTALLLAGFGLKDSIMSIVTKQFDELYKYNMVIGIKNNTTASQANNIIGTIKQDNRISDCILMREQSVDIGSGKNEKTATLMVPENKDRISDFIILRTRITNKKISLSDDGVVLTEKLSKMLKVDIGDSVYIKDGDTKRVSLKVVGITENYVSHYIYMSAELYKKVYNQDPKFQNIIAKTRDTSEEFENKLSTDLIKNNDIGSVSFTTGISKNFSDIISSLNYVVLVLIVSAGILAFVVLYNLTNINITERLREIATIKVLGFYDNEVSSYVYRENIFLTLIGIALGLVLGIFLHRFIVVTSEVEYVMFGRNISTLSYIYSAAMTVLFSGLVNFVMYFRLKRIDMVESMKSID